MTKKISELPEVVKVFLRRYWGEEFNLDEFVLRKIPALNNKSMLDVINDNNGLENIINYCNKIAAKDGLPIWIEVNGTNGEYRVVANNEVIFPKN